MDNALDCRMTLRLLSLQLSRQSLSLTKTSFYFSLFFDIAQLFWDFGFYFGKEKQNLAQEILKSIKGYNNNGEEITDDDGDLKIVFSLWGL